MKYGDDDDEALIHGQVSSLSVYTLETVGTTRTNKSTANGSVTTTKTAGTSKTLKQRLLSNTLHRKFGRKQGLGVKTNPQILTVAVAEDEEYLDAESRDVDNQTTTFDDPSVYTTTTAGTSKSRRHSLPSLSFGHVGKRQREGGNKRPGTVQVDIEGALEDQIPEGFGYVPPSSNKNSHKRRLKKLLSPKIIAGGIASAKEPSESSASTTPTKKRFYLTKTSILQHSLHVNSNDESYGDNGVGGEVLGNKNRFAQSLLEQEEQKYGGSANAHTKLPSRTEEAIECIFSTMSFRDPNHIPRQTSKEQIPRPDGGAMSCYGGGDWDEGNLENHNSSQKAAGLGSFFFMCGNPNQVLDDGEDDTGNFESTTTTAASSLWPFGQSAGPDTKLKKKPEPTITHVTDIVSQKRDFAVFLKAYDELLQTSNEHASLRNLAVDGAIVRSSSMGSNPNRMCTFCPKSEICMLPPPPPATCWPQHPICLRATPGTGMRVLGVRFSSSNTYFESPCWWKSLGMPNPPGLHGKEAKVSTPGSGSSNTPLCDMCQLLPINSGFEAKGKTLVIDFESDLFVGTLLMRVRNSRPLKEVAALGTAGSDYFAKANRKYQAAIRGEFKSPVAANRAVTGQVFPHEVISLPSKFLLKTAVSVFSVFAPQLQANFDGNALEGIQGPSFISPLASTPQTVSVQTPGKGAAVDLDASSFLNRRHGNASLDGDLQEPLADSPESIMAEHKLQQAKAGTPIATMTTTPGGCSNKPETESSSSSSGRAKVRKKFFDKQFSHGPDDNSSHIFQPGKIYTFEFLQHLVNFDTHTLDVGKTLNLSDTLNGQPLKCMGASLEISTSGAKQPIVKLNNLWSFDIWHEGLLKDANAYAELERTQKRGLKASTPRSKKK